MALDACEVYRPAKPAMISPIIVLGMHRSGTSIISRSLESLGLFQGVRFEDNHESTFFLELNRSLIRHVHGWWDHPEPLHAFFKRPQAVEMTIARLAKTLCSIHAREYLGWKRLVRYRSMFNLPYPWGWKDPRTIFTLPLWIRLFPEARLIYIARNGVDVAASLVAREQRQLARRAKKMKRRRAIASFAGALDQMGYKGSVRCLTMEGSFSLWEEYVDEAERHLAQLPNRRHVLSYEQFAIEPARHLADLAEFAGLNCDKTAITAAAAKVNPTRSLAFTKDARHAEFYQTVRQSRWMKHYGYDEVHAYG